MATTRSRTGTQAPAANTLTTLVTFGGTQQIIFQVIACNRSTAPARIRVKHVKANVDSEFLIYDLVVPPNQPLVWDCRLAGVSGETLKVQSDNGLVSFNAYSEVTS